MPKEFVPGIDWPLDSHGGQRQNCEVGPSPHLRSKRFPRIWDPNKKKRTNNFIMNFGFGPLSLMAWLADGFVTLDFDFDFNIGGSN